MDTTSENGGGEQVKIDAVEKKISFANDNDEESDINKVLNNKTNIKLLKKSQSEQLDILNKNQNSSSVNGDAGKPVRKLSYGIDFLKFLKDSPNSHKTPENISKLNLIAADPARKLLRTQSLSKGDQQNNNGSFASQFVPGFAKGGGSSRSGTPNRRSSQHGKQGKDASRSGASGGVGGRHSVSGSNKLNVIQISLSKDVKLNEAENAWKPSRVRKPENSEEENVSLDELCKKFRSILNKLSPNNFQRLIDQVHLLKIDTSEKLSSVIDLIFEKAIDEPGFSEIYALMCKELEQTKVQHSQGEGNPNEFVSFRNLILSRCQKEFEQASVQERISMTKQKEIDECNDSEKKKELLLSLEEEERKLRMRSVGNVRFIGELFKQKYIICKIMIVCLDSLIKKLEEETMECLCKLLTTIGKDLEIQYKISLQKYFDEMKAIAENKHNKLNSRIRFMLKDVIELRLNGWIPRQKLAAPKKLDDFPKESDLEHMNKNSYSKNSSSIGAQRNDRSYSGRNTGSRSVNDDGGWSVAQNRGNRNVKQNNYVAVDCAKLRMMQNTENITLQPHTTMWGKGSNTKKDAAPSTPKPNLPSAQRKNSTKTSNTYNALRDIGVETRPTKKTAPKDDDSQKATVDPKELESLKKVCTSLKADVYAELLENIEYKFSKELRVDVVWQLIVHVLSLKKNNILQILGRVVSNIINKKIMTRQEVLNAIKKAILNSKEIEEGKDQTWDFLSKFLWFFYKEQEISFWELHGMVSKIIENKMGYKFLTAFFMEIEENNKMIIAEKQWQKADKMTLLDWMTESEAEEFRQTFCSKVFETSKSSKKIADKNNLVDSFLDLLKQHTPLDVFERWVKENVKNVKNTDLVYALTEAIYIYTLCSPEFREPRFDDKSKERLNFYYPLLLTYVGSDTDLQLECLFAMQALMDKMEHPQGIALTLFEHLWETVTISSDAFVKWEADTSRPEGKGVMLKSLTSFFVILRTVDDSGSDDTSEDNLPLSIDNEY